jgi:uncharacterized protein YndB with AHSA1/START domain
MKVERKSDHAVGDDSAKAATGKSLADWYKLIDKKGGAGLGRRELGNWLVGELKVDPWWSTTIVNEYEIARGVMEKDGKPKGYTICATKSVKADPKKAYATFSTAAALDRWFGAKNKLDLKDGGRLENADGNRATVKKATPDKTIRFVWEDAGLTMPTPVEVKFQPAGAKTTVMVTIDRLQTRAEADGYRKAWGEALERLKSTLEGQESGPSAS